jgi:hypothetical protein
MYIQLFHQSLLKRRILPKCVSLMPFWKLVVFVQTNFWVLPKSCHLSLELFSQHIGFSSFFSIINFQIQIDLYYFFHFIYFFLYWAGWGYIVAFTKVLKIYQIYYTWIYYFLYLSFVNKLCGRNIYVDVFQFPFLFFHVIWTLSCITRSKQLLFFLEYLIMILHLLFSFFSS